MWYLFPVSGTGTPAEFMSLDFHDENQPIIPVGLLFSSSATFLNDRVESIRWFSLLCSLLADGTSRDFTLLHFVDSTKKTNNKLRKRELGFAMVKFLGYWNRILSWVDESTRQFDLHLLNSIIEVCVKRETKCVRVLNFWVQVKRIPLYGFWVSL